MKRVRISALLLPVRDAIRLSNTFILECQNQSAKALRAENPILFFGGGRGARGRVATVKAKITTQQQSRFCRTMAQVETGGRMFLSCSPFPAGPQDGKNPAGQGDKVWRFFLCCACGRKNTTRPLTGWIGGA